MRLSVYCIISKNKKYCVYLDTICGPYSTGEFFVDKSRDVNPYFSKNITEINKIFNDLINGRIYNYNPSKMGEFEIVEFRECFKGE